MKVKKRIVTFASFALLTGLLVGVVLAAFADKGKILGSTFSVGSSDLKFLTNLSGGIDSGNLSDELQGPGFANISSNWTMDYTLKMLNNGTSQVQVTSNANYLTANDPDDLRNIIFVEPLEWNDSNGDGLVDTGEEGQSLGRKTLVKWKTEGYNIGALNQGEVKGLILRFSTDTVSDTKQGKSGVFDFEFDSISP
ncbi:hypothetical protein C4561_02145 [candidate division WWE3 bacterium]|jgi:hypothetical protein|uniref:Uncharacterized protein n=1 Tax=candidate division WWE3 bacterium TaxID=2053526 RepID=A0A3A4ZE23_UNCKA|nr:MAG: hypothetical protein C4561_02145 [candidate division WWE3 bacterium]